MTVADALREHAEHEAERRSPLMQALLLGAADDWDGGGITRTVLEPYTREPAGSALPLRFAAALHRLVLTGQAPKLAAHYPTAGGTDALEQAWAPARRVLERETAQVRELTAQRCQTNEVGRTVPLLVGLAEVTRRTGGPLRLLEIGASAGLNLLVDRFRFGEVWGPADSPCRLPDPGIPLDLDGSASSTGPAAIRHRSTRSTRRPVSASRPACGATRWTGSSGCAAPSTSPARTGCPSSKPEPPTG